MRRTTALVLVLVALAEVIRAQPQDFPPATAAEVGLTEADLAAVLEAVTGFQRSEQVVGVELLVICNRRTVLHEALGWKDRESKEAMKLDTIFNIRSMTKPILGTGVQMLAEEGWFALDDAVADHLPPFADGPSATITVEQLLTHRSGLPWEDPGKPWEEYADLYEVVAYFAEQGPRFEPGTSFHYSDPGSDSLAVLIAEVTGEPFDEVLAERVLRPLGMHDSFALTPAMASREEQIASNYIRGSTGWERYWKPGDGCLLPFIKGSGTTWYSTPMDYARFLALWMDQGKLGEQQLLAAETVARALRPVSRMQMGGRDYPTGLANTEVHYGHHFEIFQAKDTPLRSGFGHNGSDGTYAWAWPQLDLMVLYFTQSRGHDTGPKVGALIDTHLLGPLLQRVEAAGLAPAD